jgi:pimeloyl-ACP methyl ester carboxylesterase
MATYVLVHGSEHSSWYWHLVIPQLQVLGHDAVAVDLPCEDDGAGLAEYADAVVDAATDRPEVILVAHSLAGFSAPLACDRLEVSLIVLVAAMVPRPGESAGEWWDNTGHQFPDPFDPATVFAHDLPPELAAQVPLHLRRQSDRPFRDKWPLSDWPCVPTRFLLCREDRFFPPDLLRRVVGERLGIVPDEIGGGHLAALSRPQQLVERLDQFRSEL